MTIRLSAIAFTSDITRLTENFTGRQWVFDDIDRWLQESEERFFILTGEPGVGKSAIAARLTQIRGDVAAYHFCQAGDVETVRPGRILRSLAAQLGEHLPDYGQALANTIKPVHLRIEVNLNIGSMTGSQMTAVYIENLEDSDPENELDILIRAPLEELQKMYAERQRTQPSLAIILIDSLDEAVTTTGTTLVKLLTQLSKSTSLPSWVRFILTSRSERRVLRGFEPLKPYHLRETSNESLADVQQYVEDRVDQPALLERLQVNQVQPQTLTSEIVNLSHGNFLYTTLLLNDIAAGRQTLDNLAALPKSIDDIYHGFLSRFSEEDWRDRYKPIFGVLTVAQEPISEKQISNFTKIDSEDVRESIRIVRQFFDVDANEQNKEIYSIFHQSFRDYLLDENRNSDFWCNAAKCHHRIFDYYWSFHPRQWREGDLYGWKYLAAHLSDLATITHEIRYVEKLSELMLTFDWLQAKLNATTISALLADYDKLPHDREIRSVQDAHLLQYACRLSADVLARDKTQLASQLLARIPEHQKHLRDQLLGRALAINKTWLRPLTASLTAEQSLRWVRPAIESKMNEVVFSSNGLWMAYLPVFKAQDGIVLWNLKDWKSHESQFQTLAGSKYALTISDNGQWCLYADSLGGVHRLSALGFHAWEGHAHRDLTIAHLLAISADGQRALSACYRGRLVAWDIGADRYEIIWDESDNRIRALTLDAAGLSAVAARTDGSINLVELWPTRQQILFKLNGEPSAIARSQDNAVVAAATIDGHIEVRSVHELEPPISVITILDKPISMAISSCNKYLAVGTEKGTLEVWNIADGELSARYSNVHTYGVKCVGFSYEGTTVISADEHHIKEWALKAREEEEEIRRATGVVKVTADGQCALAVLENGCLGVWNIRSGALESVLPRPSGSAFGDSGIGLPNGIALASKSARAMAWNSDLLCVWDLEVDDSVRSLSTKDTRDAAITPDGTGIVYVSGHDISLWQPDDAEIYVLGRYHGYPRHVVISPDGQHALSSGGAGEVILWRLNNFTSAEFVAMEQFRRQEIALGRRPTSLAELTLSWAETNWAKITSIAIHSISKPATVIFVESSDVIVTTDDGSLFTCDISNHANIEAQKLSGEHSASISRLLVTSDSNFAVTSSIDRTIRMWDLKTRQCVKAFNTHPGNIERISAEGDRALLSTSGGGFKIISLHDGKLIATFEGDKNIYTCDADSGLEWVVACDEGGQIHFFHFENGGCNGEIV
jgi:WD40 repeat protein